MAGTLDHVHEDEVYIVAANETQTSRSIRNIEGVGWFQNLDTPPFMAGIHAAQRWFNCCWILLADDAYWREFLLRWLTEQFEYPVTEVASSEDHQWALRQP